MRNVTVSYAPFVSSALLQTWAWRTTRPLGQIGASLRPGQTRARTPPTRSFATTRRAATVDRETHLSPVLPALTRGDEAHLRSPEPLHPGRRRTCAALRADCASTGSACTSRPDARCANFSREVRAHVAAVPSGCGCAFPPAPCNCSRFPVCARRITTSRGRARIFPSRGPYGPCVSCDVLIVGGVPRIYRRLDSLLARRRRCPGSRSASSSPRLKLWAGGSRPMWCAILIWTRVLSAPSCRLSRRCAAVGKAARSGPGVQHSIRRFEFDAWLLERSGAPLDQATPCGASARRQRLVHRQSVSLPPG